jgi:hypothetical protein
VWEDKFDPTRAKFAAIQDNIYDWKSSWFAVVALTLLFREDRHQFPSVFREMVRQED